MAGLVFFLVSWVLAGACQRHGAGVFLIVQFTIIIIIIIAFSQSPGPRKETTHGWDPAASSSFVTAVPQGERRDLAAR